MSAMTLAFFQQIVKMFLMLLIGFAAVKAGLMLASAGKGLSQVTVAVIRPCAIICAVTMICSLVTLPLLIRVYETAVSLF